VSGGIVTLAGHVNNYAGKWNAERAAKRVVGVKALVVEIDVTLAGTTRNSDLDIARCVKEALQWTTDAPVDSVEVSVERGVITLSGHVAWEYQRLDATSAVRQVPGVVDVIDRISIQPNISSAVVKTDIEAALKRRGATDGENIAVAVDGAVVTLTGAVHSWLVRDLARNSAWAAPGVRSVLDQMTVVG